MTKWTVQVVAVVAALLAVAACGSGKKNASADLPGLRVGTLMVTAPQGFSRRQVQASGGRVRGLVVSDYRVKAHSPTLIDGVFPGNRVALAVGRASGIGAGGAKQLRLPLRLSELQRPEHHSDGTAWNGLFRFHGRLYTVSFWAGRTAPPRDRTALLSALVSIRDAR